MTSTPALSRFSPLATARPAASRAAVAPPPAAGPADVVETGSSHLGLALISGLALLGTMAGTAMAQEVKLPTTALDRNAAPISQQNWEKMKAAGTVNPCDTAGAREAKERYSRAAEDLLPEADLFQAQGKTLETTAKWLDQLAQQQGKGTHKIGTGTLTVQPGKITLVTDTATKSVSRTGTTTVVEVTEDGFTTRLEDTSTYRAIKEGGTTRTLYVQGSILHKAGDFEVQNWSEHTVVTGTTIDRQTPDDHEHWELTPNLTYRSHAGKTEVKPQPNAPVSLTVFP